MRSASEDEPAPLFVPGPKPILLGDVATQSRRLGVKGAFLAAIPRAWTPEFVILTTDWVAALEDGQAPSLELPAQFATKPLIARSSIVGETIWDRGTYLSIALETPPSRAEIEEAVRKIATDARNHDAQTSVAIVLQIYLPRCIKGTLGNLNSLSRTREHWSRFTEVEGFSTIPDRFNSQRDAAANAAAPLRIPAHVPAERTFGTACRWLIDHFSQVLGRDRMLLEWAVTEDTLYLLQLDLDEENSIGLDPSTLEVTPKLLVSGRSPQILSKPEVDEITQWDKLKILDELSPSFEPLPQSLYLLTYSSAAEIVRDDKKRVALVEEFREFFGDAAVIRVSRRAGADKTTNLGCTSSSLPPNAAISWIEEELRSVQAQQADLSQLAFVVHRFIGARAGAWALYDPDSPYIQVHANWGLPDALQFYPYDAWDVHSVTEEITAYPSYKSHFLWPQADGSWTFNEVLNSIARHQCLKSNEVLEIARRTTQIGTRLGRRVAVMWFAGVETEAGHRICLPWYRTYDYSAPDLDEALSEQYVIMVVRDPSDLVKVKTVHDKPAGLRIALDIQPSEHLVRDKAFLEDIIATAREMDAAVIYSGSPFSHPYFQLKGRVRVYLRLHRKSFRTRSRIKYHKLVRDRIPERIASKHERVVYANLAQGQILQLLAGKLIEETRELVGAEGQDATAEELADVYEVLRGMMHQAGVDEARVVEIADAKRARVGGFDRGIFLLETSLPKPGQATVDVRDVDFDTLIKEEYSAGRVKVPFALLGSLEQTHEKLFELPGTDKAIRLTADRDGIELSIVQLEFQLALPLGSSEDVDE